MKEYKQIKDLGFISALMCLGYIPSERMKKEQRIYFSFEWDENMEDLENKYFSSGLMVDAYTFSTTIKAVKASIYQLQNQQ
jgi:hypothetical protein